MHKVYEDKDRLPMIYNVASIDHKSQTRAEIDDISLLWHELLSPLTVIKGYTSTLLQLDHAITKEQKDKYLRGIESASNKIIHLLENLRYISKLEENDATTLLRISLPDLIRQVASEMQNQTTKQIIRLRASTSLPLVKADPDKIEIVINNLIGNAIKYSPRSGDIEIDVQVVRNRQELIRLFKDVPMIQLPCFIVSIADTGVGIPEAELDKIFNKYYRISNKTMHPASGAGLGLYICKIIIESHGGHIWARNRLPKGSIFYFSLPLD